MLDRAIGIAGLALTLIFGLMLYLVPKMPSWIVQIGVGLGILLIGIAGGLILAGQRDTGGPESQYDLKPLLEAFERHAAEELFIATALTNNIHLPPKDISSAKHTYDRVLLTAEERDLWRGYLKRLDVECTKLGLTATHDAIKEAVDRFDGEINRVTAYWAYHAVSMALKDEIARRGRFIRYSFK